MKSNRQELLPVFFGIKTKPSVKKRGIILTLLSFLIACGQVFAWFFANAPEPYILGMPCNMFFVVALIILQFFVFLIFYLIDSKEER